MIIHWHLKAIEKLNNTILYIKDRFGSLAVANVLDEIEETVNQLISFLKLEMIAFQKGNIDYRILHSRYNRIVYYLMNDSIVL